MSWRELQPAGTAPHIWYALAADATQTNLFAAVFDASGDGLAYISNDSGENWARTYPGSSAAYWQAAASDANGSNLIVAAWAGRLYTTDDGGANWTERKPAGDRQQNWQMVMSDNDGSVLLAGVSSGRLWRSVNSGVTWAETRPAGNVNGDWRTAACNADGSIIVVGNNGGRLYRSTNSGSTWSEIQPAGNGDGNWVGASCNTDGTIIIACNEARVYTSINSGSTWVDEKPTGDTDESWEQVCCNEDGKVLVATIAGGDIYVSYGQGTGWEPLYVSNSYWTLCLAQNGTSLLGGSYYGVDRVYTSIPLGWTERFPAGDVGQNWTSVFAWGLYGNGQVLGTVTYGGDLYLSQDGGATWTAALPAADNYSLAADARGNRLIVGSGTGGRASTSNDSGVTWQLVLDTGGGIASVASSPAGQHLCAAVYFSGFWVSDDYGASWTFLDGDSHVYCVAWNTADQQHCITGGANGIISISDNGGTTWSTVTPAGTSTQWSSVAISDDGMVMLATEEQKNVWLSLNAGGTWTKQTAVGTGSWTGCSVSEDGQSMVVIGFFPKECWGSTDGGSTWTNYGWPEIASSGHIHVSISPNGKYLVGASDGNGRIYTWGVLIPHVGTPALHSFPWVGRFQLSHVTA